MITTMLDVVFGQDARNRLEAASDPSPQGAVAALETFYFAFNQRSPDVLSAIWLDAPLVQLNNPLGGILRGADEVRSLYERIFTGPARVWVEFSDVVEYRGKDTIAFAGRERGEFTTGSDVVPLAIRTSRVFAYTAGIGWRQTHHHGSIDDPDALRTYQAAVRGATSRAT